MEVLIVSGILLAALYAVFRFFKKQVQNDGTCACSGDCGKCPSQTTHHRQTVITGNERHSKKQQQ